MRLPVTSITAFLLVAALSSSCASQRTVVSSTGLQQKLDVLAEQFDGDVGIFVRHLKTGEMYAVNADSIFPSASIVKVPILVGIFDMIESGELDYKTELAYYADSVNYPGGDSGLIANHKEGAMVPLDKLIMLMITTSDNTASFWLQQIASGERINRLMGEFGLRHTRVNSRTPGREDARTTYGWGQMTPREMVSLMMGIRSGAIVSGPASEEMYRVLTRIHYDGEALAFIPPWVQAASKQGAVNRSRSEVVLVNAPSGDYVFCVVTKNQADTSWEYDNAGYQLIRDVSSLLWQAFEPNNPWQKPNYDTSKYW
jgi:beta-lactamase class A